MRQFTLSEGIVTWLSSLKHNECQTVRHYTQMAVMAELINQV